MLPAVSSPGVTIEPKVLTYALTMIAQVESDKWSEFVVKFKSEYNTKPLTFLNQHKAQIKSSDNVQLNQLFRRAVINLNENQKKQAEPALIFRHQYTPPPYLIPKAHVRFDVEAQKVLVTTTLQVKRNSNQESLILDCKDQKVLAIFINGNLLPKEAYRATKREIIIFGVPAEGYFTVETKCEIDPFTNDSGTGMYKSGKHLTTQCEAQDASRIFPTLDRPDVMTAFTTEITVDPKQYPVVISNGDLLEQMFHSGRSTYTYEDLVPKPCYLFASVLGTFESIEDTFMTLHDSIVKLKILVEPGQKERGKFALEALKASMKLEETKFGRVYNHGTLTCVAMDQFNAGAMENTTLIIYNSTRLLVDKDSGNDQQYRDVFHVIAHEYCHNWRGNLVVIRDFFEVALKEAFTDWCSMLIQEDFFGEEYSRIDQILALQNKAFPQMKSETGQGHPLKVHSYDSSDSIYDQITYTYGREVFRAFARFLDTYVPGGSRLALDDYFTTNKGKAVTFEALLASGNKILASQDKDLKQFEQWFEQQGVPTVRAHFEHNQETGKCTFTFTQSNIHPETKKNQPPLPIPFSFELIGADGKVHLPRKNIILEKSKEAFELDVGYEDLTPVFMHGYSAPVILNYPYTLEQLAVIALHSNDVYCKWKAGQDYSTEAIKTIMVSGTKISGELVPFYRKALKSDNLSNIAKSQLLHLPSLKDLAQSLGCFDFELLNTARSALLKELTKHCKDILVDLYTNLPKAETYQPTPEQMGIRDLRNTCLQLLVADDPQNFEIKAWEQYTGNRQSQTSPSRNFTDAYAAFSALVENNTEFKGEALKFFYEDWNRDKMVFNNWLSAQCSGKCNVEELQNLTKAFEREGDTIKGFDEKNPNHLRSIYRTFIENSLYFHKPDGSGYRFIVDAILKIGQFNQSVSHNYIFSEAISTFTNLPPQQQELFAKELSRLLCNESPSQTREAVSKLLESYEKTKKAVQKAPLPQ